MYFNISFISGNPYPMVLISSPTSDTLNSYIVTWDIILTGGVPITKIVIKTRKVFNTISNTYV